MVCRSQKSLAYAVSEYLMKKLKYSSERLSKLTIHKSYFFDRNVNYYLEYSSFVWKTFDWSKHNLIYWFFQGWIVFEVRGLSAVSQHSIWPFLDGTPSSPFLTVCNNHFRPHFYRSVTNSIYVLLSRPPSHW